MKSNRKAIKNFRQYVESDYELDYQAKKLFQEMTEEESAEAFAGELAVLFKHLQEAYKSMHKLFLMNESNMNNNR